MQLEQAFEERAFEDKEMEFEGKGQALEEVGRTAEIVGGAILGIANFLNELKKGNGMALLGKR